MNIKTILQHTDDTIAADKYTGQDFTIAEIRTMITGQGPDELNQFLERFEICNDEEEDK